MVYFVKVVQFFLNYALFHELSDWMGFEADCVKSHYHAISEGLSRPISMLKFLHVYYHSKSALVTAPQGCH